MRIKNYILRNWEDPLIQFVSEYLNEHSFMRIQSLRKEYREKNRDPRTKRAIAIFIGRIIKELCILGIVQAWRETNTNRTYKITFKGNLLEILEKELEKGR